MSHRSSVVAVVASAMLLAAGAAGLIGNLHTARAADEGPGKLEEGPAVKAILPDLQKDLAGEPRFKRIRLDDVKIETTATTKTAAFTGLWLIETEGTVAEQKALHDWIKPRAAALLKKKLNAGAKPDATLDKEIDQLAVDEHGIAFARSPVVNLREKAVGNKELDGAVFTDAAYAADGKLEITGYVAKDKEAAQGKLIDTLLHDPAVVAAEILGKKAGKPVEPAPAGLKPIDYAALKKHAREEFAADKAEPLLHRTRVDDVSFGYAKAMMGAQALVLRWRGVCLDGDKKAALKAALEKASGGLLPKPAPEKYDTDVSGITFRDNPTLALQDKIAADPALDGTLILGARYDGKGALRLRGFIAEGDDAKRRLETLLRDKLKGTGVLVPDDANADHISPDDLTALDWQGLLKGLRKELASSREPLSQRTRVDRLYFTYVGNDTGTPQLKVESVSLQVGPAADSQKALAKTIQTRYEAPLRGVEFRTAADTMAFITSPVVGLQAMAIDRRLDESLFEDAVYDAEGRLHLRVYLGESVKPAQIDAIVASPAARETLKPALGKRPGQDKEEVDKPKPFPWRGEGGGMVERFQKGFAASDVRAARQTRVDRAYFLYDKQAMRQLHFEGVSLWDGLPKATLGEALAPACRTVLPEPAYQVAADKVARKPNPAPALQDKLAAKPEWDGILFEDAYFNAGGRLVFPVLIAESEAQRLEVTRLLKDPPLADGILPADPARRQWEGVSHRFNWSGMLKDVRAWAAGPTAPRDARRTRLDRAYFTREDGGCQLQLVGATLLTAPEGEPAAASAVRARVADSVGKRCVELLRPLKLQVPGDPKPLARAVVPARRDLVAVLRADIAGRRSLDGINITDVVYDEAGKVALEGHWLGEGQARELGDLLRDALRPEDPVLTKNGTTLERLRVVRTDLLLRDLRKWLIDKTDVEEVLFDRLYFDAAGKLRIDGFFTRPQDQAVAEKAGLDALLAYPVGGGLLGLDSDGVARPAIEGKEVIHLGKRPSLVEHLRKEIPADPALDGLRVDRCWYDADAVFVLNGLEDAAGQARALKPLLDAAQQGPAFKGNLPAGWRLGTFTVVPLRKMLRCLQRIMPADPLYDGVTLERAFHDAANHLVLTGAITLMDFPGLDQARIKVMNQRRDERARKALHAAITADPNWRLRLSYGGPDVVLKAAPADLELAVRAFERATHRYGHERKVARALADLDVTIFNNPADATAWYFRAVCEMALGDEAAARRDLRRVLGFAEGLTERLDRVIDYSRLELVQGINRGTTGQTVRKMALAPPADKSAAELVHELCEEPLKAPVLPDEAPGWDRPFVTRTPPVCPRCGPPCWLPP